jgi:hypothetical protein
MNLLRIAIALLAALALAGCGERSKDESAPAATAGETKLSDRLVDFSLDPPFVNDLDVDPKTSDFLLTTNRGFWRISPDGKKVEQMKSKVSADGQGAPIGTFLSFTVAGPDLLYGSGHPDTQQPLPQYLGFLRSEDGGQNWISVARLGEADLHKLIVRDKRIYAFDAVLGAMLITEDGGRTWTERFTPRGLVIDFVVDPEDPKYLVAATEDQLYKTEDEGQGWRPLDPGEGFRLAWPAPGKLYRAEKDGTIRLSADKGASWEEVGKVEGEPYKFHEVGPDELLLALSDGSIVETKDGGKTWSARFKP